MSVGPSNPITRDYLSCTAPFHSDSIPLRQDYERFYLDHRAALQSVAKAPSRTMAHQTTNEEVFDPHQGLRVRLARNHQVCPPRETRQAEIARTNALLVEKLTEIAFKNKSATTTQILERNKKVGQSRLAPGGSLNDHIRALEKARIEEDNFGLATRLLQQNKSQYAPETFRDHVKQHEYLVKNKSRLRAIQMKTSTPGQYLGKISPRRATTADPSIVRNKAAEGQANDEYAGAIQSYSHQQANLGYGLTVLPPIPGTTDAQLLGHEDEWLEQHQSDLQRLKQIHTHAPKVRQSKGINPREALHAPLSKHYHHQQQQKVEATRIKELRQAFENLAEEELVVPRTRLDPTTGSYEITWIELKHARPDETHLAQRRPDVRAAEVAAQQRAEAEAIAYQQAQAQWQYQQQATAMYQAYVQHINQQQQAAAAAGTTQQTQPLSHPTDESKEPSSDGSQSQSQSGPFIPQPPSASRTLPDGTPYVEPQWPFAGTILPPHLMPPESFEVWQQHQLAAQQQQHSQRSPRKKPSALNSPSTRRGRVGRQIFKIRKTPQGSASAVNHASSKVTEQKEMETTTPLSSSSQPQPQTKEKKDHFQTHAQYVESIGKYTAAAAAVDGERSRSNSPSKSSNIPTIASALASSHIPGASGVPITAFKDEFEGPHFMQANASTTAGMKASPRKSIDAKRSSTKTVIAPPPAAANTLTHIPSKEQLPVHVERKPLVHEQAPVQTKVAAFEQWNQTAEEETSNQLAARRDSEKADVAPTKQPIAAPPAHTPSPPPSSALPSDAPGMLQIGAGTGKRSSLRTVPLDFVSSNVAERNLRRKTMEKIGQIEEVKQELAEIAAKEKNEEVKPVEKKAEQDTQSAAASTPSAPSAVEITPEPAPAAPTSRYSEAHPFSIAHSPSASSLGAAAATTLPSATPTPNKVSPSTSVTNVKSEAVAAAAVVLPQPTTTVAAGKSVAFSDAIDVKELNKDRSTSTLNQSPSTSTLSQPTTAVPAVVEPIAKSSSTTESTATASTKPVVTDSKSTTPPKTSPTITPASSTSHLKPVSSLPPAPALAVVAAPTKPESIPAPTTTAAVADRPISAGDDLNFDLPDDLGDDMGF